MDTADDTEAEGTAQREMSAVTSWLGFGVAVSVVSLGYRAFCLYQNHQAWGLASVLSSGELLLISAVLMAGAYGEFVRAFTRGSVRWGKGHSGTTLGAVIVLMCSSLFYGTVSTKTASDFESAMRKEDPFVTPVTIAMAYRDYLDVVVWLSLGVFIATVIIGVLTIKLAGKGGNRG